MNSEPELHSALCARLCAALDATCVQRRRQFGPGFHQDDYLVGGLTVIQALGLWPYVPPRYTVGILTGRLGMSVPLAEGEHEPTDSERLRYHEKMIRDLRQANGWSDPGQEIGRVVRAQHWDGHDLVLVADGSGQAVAYWTHFGRPVDNLSHVVQQSQPEEQALAWAGQFGDVQLPGD